MILEELTFQRASVHLVHDAQRLQEGKDLNDALLDFFVKLGQALIPESGTPAVAYLGSHFYDVLRKGGVSDGRVGHRNVANWAKRRLGRGGLWANSIGALAVPVNEVLRGSYDGSTDTQEKHWWLALLLNPRAVGSETEEMSLLCLDSFVRAETQFEPPVTALRGGKDDAYPVEVRGLSRIGFQVHVLFRAQGDGSAGALPEPRKSKLRAGGRAFANTTVELRARDRGCEGQPGALEGSLGFRLDRRGAAKTGGLYTWEYGDVSDDYQPPLKLRMGQKPTPCQSQVARFLEGYLERERETEAGSAVARSTDDKTLEDADAYKPSKVEEAICLPGVPQQETSHDCGFFILEMIMRALQLSSQDWRDLASASSVEIAMLPWPSQKQVLRRKAMLREALDTLVDAAKKCGSGDVEVLLRADAGLKAQLRSALQSGCPSFSKGFERWAAGDWDLSPSPSRSGSRAPERKAGASGSSASRKGKRKGKRKRSSDSSPSRRRRRKRKRSTSRSRKKEERGVTAPRPAAGAAPGVQASAQGHPQQPALCHQDLLAMSAVKLRALCVHHGVLPHGAVERDELISALAPFVAEPPRPSRWDKMAPTLYVTQPSPPGTAGAAHQSFTREDLDNMPSKMLRELCQQRSVLPPGPVERSDLLKALAPLAAGP